MIPRKVLRQIAAALGGVPVWGSVQGGPTSEAGVQYGDIVIVVNGMRTPTISDYLQARKLRSDGVELQILRGGNRITLHLEFRSANTTILDALAEKIVEGRFFGAPALGGLNGKGTFN
jgi:S1-C subfamily serine protease